MYLNAYPVKLRMEYKIKQYRSCRYMGKPAIVAETRYVGEQLLLLKILTESENYKNA